MTKRLLRSSRGKIVAGVCAGLGEYFEIDPVLIRALFIIATFSGGVGLLTYLTLWAIMPKDETPLSPVGQPSGSELDDGTRLEKRKSSVVAGIALVAMGAFFLARQFIPAFDVKFVLPFALIAVGVAIIISALRNKQPSTNQ